MTIDSGAIDTCLPKGAAKAFPLKESPMSKAGANYRAANGSPNPNYGERLMNGVTDEWTPFALIAQVADVRTALGSVRSMIQAGNRVIFGTEGCMILNKKTGKEIPMHQRNGGFEIDLWVEKGESRETNESGEDTTRTKFAHKNTYQMIAEETGREGDGEEDPTLTMDFIRQDKSL